MKRVALTAAGILATVTAFVLMWQLSGIVVLFVVSLAVAAMVRAPAEWLARRGWAGAWAITAAYLLVIGVPLLILAWVIWRLLVEIDPLTNDLMALYVRAYSLLQNSGDLWQSLATRLPAPTDLTNSLTNGQGNAWMGNVMRTVTTVGGLLSQLLIAIVVSIYWTADQLHFERIWLSLLSPEHRAQARNQWRMLESGVGSYLRSELVQSIVAGALLTLVYWLLGFRYPVALAFVGALCWFIPLVGGLLAVIPVALLGFAISPAVSAIAVGLTLLVFLAMEFYLESRLYTRDRYWRTLVLLVMLAMTDAFGLIGLLVAPPLATAIQLWLNSLLTPAPAPPVETHALDFSELHAKLEEARKRVQDEETASSPRLASLFKRLETLIGEAEEAGA
jgi:predicted PurR-regulated permease PerM